MTTKVLTHEPSLEPKDGYYITDDQGCEIYEGQTVFNVNGTTMCAECFKNWFEEWCACRCEEQIAEALSEYENINFGLVHDPEEVDPIWG